MKRVIVAQVWHCSALEYGTLAGIKRHHESLGWSDTGYHSVIHNGYPNRRAHLDNKFYPDKDGIAEYGRELGIAQAHVKGPLNYVAVGNCLIGNRRFTIKQLETAIQIAANQCETMGCRPHDTIDPDELDWTKLMEMGLQPTAANYRALQGLPKVLGHYEVEPRKTCPNFEMDFFRDLVERELKSRDFLRG